MAKNVAPPAGGRSPTGTLGKQPPKGGSFSRPRNATMPRGVRQLRTLANCVADLCRTSGQLEWIDILEEEGLIEHTPEADADLIKGDMGDSDGR